MLLDFLARLSRSVSKALTIVPADWLRIEPEAISKPLQTMSYWIRLDGQRILAVQRLHAALRHRERVVGEVDLLFVLVPFVEREVDDPAQLEAVAVDEVQILAGAGARRAGERVRTSSGSPATKKTASPSDEAELLADRLGALLADVLGDADRRLRACRLPCARRCSRGPAGPRPAPRSSCGRRRRAMPPVLAGMAQTSTFGFEAIMLANTLKPEPRKCSVTSCISIGLRRSGLSVP